MSTEPKTKVKICLLDLISSSLVLSRPTYRIRCKRLLSLVLDLRDVVSSSTGSASFTNLTPVNRSVLNKLLLATEHLHTCKRCKNLLEPFRSLMKPGTGGTSGTTLTPLQSLLLPPHKLRGGSPQNQIRFSALHLLPPSPKDSTKP